MEGTFYTEFFVYLLTGFRSNYPADFHEIRRQRGTWPRKDPLDFGDNSDHVTLGIADPYPNGGPGGPGTPQHKYLLAYVVNMPIY